MQVPPFLLRRLYVKGSLRNTGDDVQFDIKNTLGAGYAEAMLPLTIDNDEIPMDAASFTVDGETTPFTAVTSSTPFTLAMNKLVTITVAGRHLADGKHKVALGFVVTGMGTMQFDVTDAIGDAGGEDGAAATSL